MALYFRTNDAGGGNRYFRTSEKVINTDVPEGWTVVTLVEPLAPYANRLKATPDLVAGDRVAVGNILGGGTFTLYNDGSYTYNAITSFQYMVDDGTGWSEAKTVTLQNLPTLISTLPDVSSMQGQAINIDLNPYFADETSFSVSGLPASTGLVLASGVLSGTLSAADRAASPISVVVTASNADGSVGDTFVLTVAALAVPVLTSAVPDRNWQENTPVSFDIGAYFTGTIDMALSGLPIGTGLIFNAGILEGTPNAADLAASPITATVEASNTFGATTDTFVINITAMPVNAGLRVSQIYAPNSSALVGDVPGATAVVYDQLGGNELWQGTVNITNGDLVIDNDAVGAIGSTAFLIVRWTGFNSETVYAATETVINLDA